jgi:hypothetical protein
LYEEELICKVKDKCKIENVLLEKLMTMKKLREERKAEKTIY